MRRCDITEKGNEPIYKTPATHKVTQGVLTRKAAKAPQATNTGPAC